MPIRLGTGKQDREWGEIARSAAEAAIQAIALGKDGFSSSISAVFKTIKSLQGTDSLEATAKLLFMSAASVSISEMIAQLDFGVPPNLEQSDHITGQVLLRLETYCNESEVLIDCECLKYPQGTSFAARGLEFFIEEADFLIINNDRDDIRRTYFSSFAKAVHSVRVRDPESYNNLILALTGPDAAADSVYRNWDRYRSYLISNFESTALFGQEGRDPITLSRIYQPLRCVWIENDLSDDDLQSGASYGVGPQHQEDLVYNFDMLDELLKRWMEDTIASDNIRLISGGPGSGKSTFAKAFASEIASDESWRVLVIPLQRLRLGGDIQSKVNDFLKNHNECLAFRETPPLVSFGRDNHQKWMFIFDGLDELAKEGAGSETVAQEFATALSDWRYQIPAHTKCRFIVLGRAPSMQQARKRLNLEGAGTLHVVDMRPNKWIHAKERTPESRGVVINDPANISLIDQRISFWTRWALASRIDVKLPDSMTSKTLEDLTKEPLLAYLLIVSGYATDRWEVAATNRNYIYEAIFNQIWERERSKQTRILLNDIGKIGFDSIMQALGLAAWRGGGRTGDESTFNAMSEIFIRPDIYRKAKASGIAELDNVAILFYTKRDERDGRGYELLHKSFGEYLTAKGLFDGFLRWSSQVANPDSDFSERDFLSRWLHIAGQSAITSEILLFLRNEANARANSSGEAPFIFARRWLPVCIQLIDHVLKFGHDGFASFKDWREAEKSQNNAELNLFAILDACARVAYPDELLGVSEAEGGWRPGPVTVPTLNSDRELFSDMTDRFATAFRNDFHYIFDRSVAVGHMFATNLLSRLNFDAVNMGSRLNGFVDFYGSKFDHIFMFNFHSNDAVFIGAEFESCNFFSSMFSTSSFTRALLSGVAFRECEFRGVDFSNAEIRQCSFEKCEFSDCNFSETVFSNTKFLSCSALNVMLTREQLESVQELELDEEASTVGVGRSDSVDSPPENL